MRFDTWQGFANLPKFGPAKRLDVILSINEEHGVRRVLDYFDRWGLLASARPIAAGSFAAAELALDDLVRVVLPLTNLYSVLSRIQRLPAHQWQQLIQAGSMETGGSLPR